MKIFDFIRDAGEKLMGSDDKDDKNEQPAVRTMDAAQADKRTSDALTSLIAGMKLDVQGLEVKFRDGKAIIKGQVPSQAIREKIVLIAGNARGVAQVEDRMEVVAAVAEPEAVMYTVKSGDTLSKIAKEHYGAASQYMKIFDANTPMLKDPNKIYPGQVLRIPK